MNDQVTPFSFEKHTLRVFDINNKPWFSAADVCNAIGIANHRDAISRLDPDEVGVGISDTLGGAQQINVINESGLYTVILRSQGATTPGTAAHRFRKWVTSEVLPALRKTGHYEAPRPDPRPFQAEALQAAREAGALRDENLRLKDDLIEAQRQVIQFLTRNEPAPRAAPRPLTEHEKNIIRDLHRDGLGTTEISKRIQRSKSAVHAVLRYEGEAA